MRRNGPASNRAIELSAVVGIALLLSAGPLHARSALDTLDLTPAESTAVAAIGDWIRASRPDPPIWPGYAPESLPAIVYVPDRWAMILNPPPGIAAELRPVPAAWPDPGSPAGMKVGGLEGLVGQLAFGFEIGSTETVAVPLLTELPLDYPVQDLHLVNFAFVAHEAFHQHQRDAFGTVETRPEERYPILDPVNAAWAAVEMRILDDAVSALSVGDTARGRAFAETFVAVREKRWGRADEVLREIERQKEHVEGTAKYVEIRTVGRLPGRAEGAYLHEEFERFLEDGALAPGDVPRNRVYAVGAAVGLLLDAFGPGWKVELQRAEAATGLAQRLDRALGVPEGRRDWLAGIARDSYRFERVLRASERLAKEHVDAFERRARAFETAPGVRVRVSASRLPRSRASREPRIVLDRGRRSIGRYIVYTLRHRGERPVVLEVHDRVVLEEEPGGENRRTTAFRVDAVESLRIDGTAVDPSASLDRGFDTIALAGPGVRFESALPGRISIGEGGIRIRLAVD